MLKRILLLVAETASSYAARDYAFRLAKQCGAEVAGLAGIDLYAVDVRMPGTLSAISFKAKLDEELKAQASQARQRLRGGFEQQCRDAGVAGDWLSFEGRMADEGDMAETLHLAAETCDLLISGHDTMFRGELFETRSEMVSKLLMISPRPVVICPEELSKSGDILVAYDGSMPAMRALQLFVLLGIGADRRIQVTSIDEDRNVAERRVEGAAKYLRSHGLEVSVAPVTTSVHPAEVLRIQIAQCETATMVMGAYGNRGLREMLFGSTTNPIVENPPCPLFLYR